MAGWLTLAKVIAPHVSTIVSAALPAFTTRKSEEVGSPGALVQQQIAELQQAVTTNDTHIRDLAEQLRLAVEVLDKRAAAAAHRMRLTYLLCGAATVLSGVALVVSLR